MTLAAHIVRWPYTWNNTPTDESGSAAGGMPDVRRGRVMPNQAAGSRPDRLPVPVSA